MSAKNHKQSVDKYMEFHYPFSPFCVDVIYWSPKQAYECGLSGWEDFVVHGGSSSIELSYLYG